MRLRRASHEMTITASSGGELSQVGAFPARRQGHMFIDPCRMGIMTIGSWSPTWLSWFKLVEEFSVFLTAQGAEAGGL
ncbi:hypothetical protein GCM10022285_50870 [Streptomyces tunisiensis]|uniref:Uncharacterized protein n=1 Tax=Streptomyces tunisiensis TaxID=948699 RepID=A0ABP7Z2Y1_9ACTN